MKLLTTFLSICGLIGLCLGQGAPWNEEETEIIKEKVWSFVSNPNPVINEFRKLYPDYEEIRQTSPNFKKVVL